MPGGAVDTLVTVLEARPDVAIAGPRLIDGDGRAELSFGRMMSPLAELRQKFLVRGSRRAGPVAAYVESMTRKEQEVDWVSGACMLVRRTDAEVAGLMDERYFMYAEDVDFCAAVRARGRKVLVSPCAEVVNLRVRSRATGTSPTQLA